MADRASLGPVRVYGLTLQEVNRALIELAERIDGLKGLRGRSQVFDRLQVSDATELTDALTGPSALNRMRREEQSAENAGSVTLVAGPTVTTIASVDLGTVNAGDRFLFTAGAIVVKGATAEVTGIGISKLSGTGDIRFKHDRTGIHNAQFQTALSTWEFNISGIGKVTTSGTLAVRLHGDSSGSNGTVNAGDGEIHVFNLRG